ncbi:MAG: pyridoxal 5'-phosphate synthase glutaminase subunit PdxT [Methanoregulaceae archaeon]|nr:pyridoxal 5'-phosphate synthase glutaminase subunit PdxT [Methanoregulaceae archaeon]
MQRKVGVVAVQGDYAMHIAALRGADSGVDALEVRTPEELATVDQLIIPGGESSTVGLLMQRFGLGEAIVARASEGMPIWGTCMGMILMAREVEGRDQYRLGLLDITVRRNAFGAQVHSFEDTVSVAGFGETLGVFIRAPIVTQHGSAVEVLATYGEQIVAVREGNRIGTSFHPELTDDPRMHTWFLSL